MTLSCKIFAQKRSSMFGRKDALYLYHMTVLYHSMYHKRGVPLITTTAKSNVPAPGSVSERSRICGCANAKACDFNDS